MKVSDEVSHGPVCVHSRVPMRLTVVFTVLRLFFAHGSAVVMVCPVLAGCFSVPDSFSR